MGASAVVPRNDRGYAGGCPEDRPALVFASPPVRQAVSVTAHGVGPCPACMRSVRTVTMSLLVVIVWVSFARSPPIGTAYIALVAVSSLDMDRDPAAPEPDATGCHARGFGLEGTIVGMLISDKAAATVYAFAAARKGLIDWVLSRSGVQVTPMPGCSAVVVGGGVELEEE
jgi:hypothetical protein